MPVVTPGPSSSTTSWNPAGEGSFPFQNESSAICVTAYPAVVRALSTSTSVPPSAITSTLPIVAGPGAVAIIDAVAGVRGAGMERVVGGGSFVAVWMFSGAGTADGWDAVGIAD